MHLRYRPGFTPLILIILLTMVFVSPAFAQQTAEQLTGTIDDETPFHDFPIQVTESGFDIIIDMVRAEGEAGGNLDTLLYLIDDENRIVASNDDRTPDDVTSFIRFPEIAPGNYRIIATRFSGEAGTTSGDFVIDVTLEPTTPIVYNYDISDEALVDAGFPEMPIKETAEWTIIAYYGGDTGLEESILNDVKEFELGGGTTDNVNVLVLVDRHPEYSRVDGDWQSARLYELGDAETVGELTIDSEYLVDFGSIDSGDGDFFAKYLAWSLKHYPAENYALALASHGAGWRGIITDESTRVVNILTLPELNSALSLAQQTAGVEKFDILINDACLMSSIEYHDIMSDYFRFSYASPEIVIGSALDMTLLLESLKDGENDLVTLGSALVDKYISVDAASRPGADSIYLTHSVTDLSRYDALREAIDNFASLYESDPLVYSETFGKARANTYTYTAFAGQEELIDLGSFMTQIEASSKVTEQELRAASVVVREALNDVVLYGNAGERAMARTTYQNIYFPLDGSDFELSYFDQTSLDSWARMLRSYYNVVTPNPWVGNETVAFHAASSPKINITSIYPPEVTSVERPLSMTLEVIGSNLSSGEGTVDQLQPDGTKIRYLSQRIVEAVATSDNTLSYVNQWDAGYNRTEISWDATLPVVTDGVNAYRELLLVTEEDNIAALEGRYREPDSETWNNVTIVFDIDGNFQRVINRSGNNALGVVEIPVGADFETFKSVVSPDGRTSSEIGNRYVWPEGGPSWDWEPAPTGDYDIGLVISNFGGTTGFQSLRVTIDNSAVNPDVRAVSRQDIGVVFAHPADWTKPSLFFNENTGAPGLKSFNEEATADISLYLYTLGMTNSLDQLVQDIASLYELTVSEIYTPTTIDGVPAIEFEYSYATNSGDYTGRAIAFVQPGNGVGMSIGAASSDETIDNDELFNFIKRYTRIFDPQDMSVPEYQWGLFYGATYEFNGPITWLPEQSDTWTQYTDSEAEDQFYATRIEAVDEQTTTEDVITRTLDEVSNDLTDLQIVEERTYNTIVPWQVTAYTAERDGEPVYGRLYTTIQSTSDYDTGEVGQFAYVIRTEAPDNDALITTVRYVFEPVVDNFIMYLAGE